MVLYRKAARIRYPRCRRESLVHCDVGAMLRPYGVHVQVQAVQVPRDQDSKSQNSLVRNDARHSRYRDDTLHCSFREAQAGSGAEPPPSPKNIAIQQPTARLGQRFSRTTTLSLQLPESGLAGRFASPQASSQRVKPS